MSKFCSSAIHLPPFPVHFLMIIYSFHSLRKNSIIQFPANRTEKVKIILKGFFAAEWIVNHNAIKADMGAFSDQALTLAALAPFAATPTTITGIAEISGSTAYSLPR